MKKLKSYIAYSLIILSISISCGVLVIVSGYVFVKGIPIITTEFIFNDFDDKWYWIEMTPEEYEELEIAINSENEVIVQENNNKIFVATNGDEIKISEKDIILNVNGQDPTEIEILEEETLEVKVEKKGGGIWPMIITTFYSIILSLTLALPLGIGTAIYLVEYSNSKSKINKIIHITIDNLAGIPSIIFGLFGMIFFVTIIGFGFSLLSAALTLAIMLMPTIIKTTEEALKAVPKNLKEASYGLGVGKIRTITKVIIPSAMSGILVAVILSIGRVIGESAILLFTAGTVTNMPTSIYDSASTLTVQAYLFAKENGDIPSACAIGIIIIAIVIILNILTKILAKKVSYDMKG